MLREHSVPRVSMPGKFGSAVELPLLLLPVVLIALGPVLRLLAEAFGFGTGLTLDHAAAVLTRPSTLTALQHR